MRSGVHGGGVDRRTDGIFGIIGGSPWQQSKQQGIQPVQKSPTGTPSKGRPTGQPAGKKTTNTNPAKQPGQKAALEQSELANMSPASYSDFLDGARNTLSEDDYVEFLDWVGKKRFTN